MSLFVVFFLFSIYSVQDRWIKVIDGSLYGGLFTVERSDDISISLITSWKKKSSNSQERNPLWSAAIQHLGPSEETESHPGHHPLIMMYQVPACPQM